MTTRFIAVLIMLFLAGGLYSPAKAETQVAYRLRAGDILDISVWQDNKLNREVAVAPDGRISFPLAGHLMAEGRTLEGLEKELVTRLQKQFTDQVDVSIALATDLRDRNHNGDDAAKVDPAVYITGEVNKPGQYFYKVRPNVLQALAMAGGLGPFAAGKKIRIRHKKDGSEQLLTFNYDAFTSGKSMAGNITLNEGDVVIVPEKGLFE